MMTRNASLVSACMRMIAALCAACLFCLVAALPAVAALPPDQPVGDSFTTQALLDKQEAGTLEITGKLADAAIDANAEYQGILLNAKRSVLENGRIELGTYDFGDQTVGRLTVDALTERGWTGTVDVYLDGADDPAASIAIPHLQGKAGWAYPGTRTADVLPQGISGSHEVALGLRVSKASDPEADKKAKVLLRSIEFVQASIPTVYLDLDESQGSIDAMNGSADHSKECYGSMRVETPAGYTCEYTGETAGETTSAEYALEYIRGRGNSTWMADKKPYKVKLDKKADLFGMGANKHWILLANRYDNSFLRNKATYWLGQELGLDFTPQCVFVDVVMNGEYYGSYYLCEQVRVGSSRVDIVDLEDEPDASDGMAVTGGYLLSMDTMSEEEGGTNRGFTTEEGHSFTIESPEFDGYFSEAQFNYIKGFVQKVEDTINAKGFKLDGTSYDELLDVPSALDYYWVQDVSLNGDAYLSGSTYLYKDRDTADAVSKLHWGPLWDFDFVAWGDLQYSEYSTDGFRFDEAPWATRLLSNKAFAQQMVDRWPTLKGKLQAITEPGGMLDQWESQLEVSRYYDVEKYGAYESGWWWEDDETASEPRTYAQEVDQLRGWIDQRIAWVDENLASIEPVPCTIEYYVDGELVESVEGVVGRPIGTLPKAPEKSGYTFEGWFFDDPEFGGQGSADEYTAAIGPTMKIHASYIDNADIVPAKHIYFQQDEAYCALDNDTFDISYEVKPDEAWGLLQWSSSDESLATVNDYGTVQLLGAGTVTITAASPGGAKASYKLHIKDEYDEDGDLYGVELPQSIKVKQDAYAKLSLTFDPPTAFYQYVEWTSLDEDIAYVGPAGVVQGVSPGTTYVLASVPGISSGVAACKVTVTGDTVNISKKAKVAKVKNQAYTGKKISPKLKVTYKGKTLKLKRDYTVTYSNNKKIGVAKAKIAFKGAYKGKKTVKFKIVPKGTTVKKLVKAKKGFTVKWKKQAKQTSGYRVQYSTNAKFKNNVRTMKVKGAKVASKAFSKLKSKKTYYVRVGTYKVVNGKAYYSAWSKAKKVKTK